MGSNYNPFASIRVKIESIMSTQLLTLYHLQQIDRDIAEQKGRLGEVLLKLKGSAEAEEARIALDEVQIAWHKAQTEQTNCELEMGALEEKIVQAETRLYNGKVVNPKELIDLQNELESLMRRRGHNEDRLLGLMATTEGRVLELKSAEQRLSQLQTAWQQTSNQLTQEKVALATTLNELLSKRQSNIEYITPAIYQQYEQLRKTKKGSAIAPLNLNACGVCQLTLSSTVIKRINQGQIEPCPSCGRLLLPHS